jgi:hypothetical protein
MARPKKQTVDYFPHSSTHGKTIYILEQRYQFKGYAFWFKLLEELCNHEGHFIDLNDETEMEFLSAKTGFLPVEMIEVLNLLEKLNKIDSELWKNKVIWCQNLINNIADVYRNRKTEIPQKPVSTSNNPVSTTNNRVSTVRNPQSKVKESKEEILSSNDDTKQQNNISVKNRSESQRVIDYWIEKWEKTFNKKRLSVKWDIYVKNTNPIVKQLGVDRMKQLLDLWFIDDEWGKKCKWEYGAFIEGSNINKLNTQL